MATQKQYKYTLPIGYRLKGGENDYVIEEVLGKGGFGVTYKVKATIFVNKISFDVHFAVKEYFPDICSRMDDNATIKIPETKQDEITDGIKDFLNEGRKLQQVCDLNPNIVNVNEVFQANGTAYYVLEYLEGGDLRKMVKNGGKPLTEQQMLEVMTPIGRAVQCLHDNHILHLDIKPDNIVMRRKSDGTEEPVLIDFGIAVHFGNDGMPTSKTPSQGISPGYSPIEQYSPVKKFEPRIDVYSFTATCLYLLTGKDPMEAFDMTPATLRSEIPQTVSPNIAQALIHAMSKDKHDRTSSVEEMMREMVKSEETIQIVPEKPSTKPENATVNLAEKAAAVRNVKEEKPKVEKKPAAKQKTDAKPVQSGTAKSVAKPPQPSIGLKKEEDKRKKGIATIRNCLIIAVICATLIAGLAALGGKCSSSNHEEQKKRKQEIVADSNDSPDMTTTAKKQDAKLRAAARRDREQIQPQEHDILYMKEKNTWVIDSIKSDKYRHFAMAITNGDVQEVVKIFGEMQKDSVPINGFLPLIVEKIKQDPETAKGILKNPDEKSKIIDLMRIRYELCIKIDNSVPMPANHSEKT